MVSKQPNYYMTVNKSEKKKNVSMRPWVTISGVNEAITAKDIVKLPSWSVIMILKRYGIPLWHGVKNAVLTSEMV